VTDDWIRVEVHNGVHIRARTGSLGPNERYRILMKRREAKQGERGGMGFLIRTARVRVPPRPPTPWKQKACQGRLYVETDIEHRTSFPTVRLGVCFLVACSGSVLSGVAA